MTTEAPPHDRQVATEHEHPPVRTYLIVGAVLFVITAVEVSLFYLEPTVGRAVAYPLLLILSAGKFLLVAMFYMHLKFDSRLFTGLFTFGLTVMVALILVLGVLFWFSPVHRPL